MSNTRIYRVKITPLEPYTFGTENGFKRKGVKSYGNDSYYMNSADFPEQTTLVGMLRFMVLQQKNLVRTDYNYDTEQRAMMASCIGEQSFNFTSKVVQNFGCIENISPLFLMDSQLNYYVKNPYMNMGEDEFKPMSLGGEIQTSAGVVALPSATEYNPKDGHAGGYYNLNTKKIISTGDIIESTIIVGNKKNGVTDDNDDGFFKREVKHLKDGFSFALFVETSEDILPAVSMASMGYKKSLFKVECEQVEANDLVERVQSGFGHGEITPWFYALSDLMVEPGFIHPTFSIVEGKQIRNLETDYSGSTYSYKMKKSMIQHNLIQSGSVFYKECPSFLEDDKMSDTFKNAKKIGYNHILKIG